MKLRDQAEHTLLHTATTHTGTHTENNVLEPYAVCPKLTICLINNQTTGHQSSAGLHTDVTLDLDVSGHDDISVDTKAPVQGADPLTCSLSM